MKLSDLNNPKQIINEAAPIKFDDLSSGFPKKARALETFLAKSKLNWKVLVIFEGISGIIFELQSGLKDRISMKDLEVMTKDIKMLGKDIRWIKIRDRGEVTVGF